MERFLLVTIALLLLGAGAALALFARWLSRSWVVVDEGSHENGGRAGIWLSLKNLFGRGPPRLTYRRDEKGRFRKYRR